MVPLKRKKMSMGTFSRPIAPCCRMRSPCIDKQCKVYEVTGNNLFLEQAEL